MPEKVEFPEIPENHFWEIASDRKVALFLKKYPPKKLSDWDNA